MSDPRRRDRRVVIIGSDFSGLCLGIHYNRMLQLELELERCVWATTSRSGYETANGKITNSGSETTARYGCETRRADLGANPQQQRARCPQ